ncbi:SH3-like domain-containing protein [Nonomuraea sp. NEAU-A123]|uniref:SH3-like domain-containing protein n=1 Tax=Nonomuraea sp. NEAU-A123 TaxID=2839649 RepID=UPI001BE4BAAA|nr:SH3-like domain-containing protein [Nonomuraea sp. NEAU-A123]MBT2230048.1 SH3-like domain-containing protein [Nonomuraea sp. NEAU-A123]MBT2230682.1 SH3-like domain-containing protein [Nonomuraea sp. NEAU-A123]
MTYFSRPRGVASLAVGIAVSATLLGGVAGEPAVANAGWPTSAARPLTPEQARKSEPETVRVLQLKYRITKACTIFYNHPSRAKTGNKSWILTPRPGKITTIKWRYNADADWAVVSVGGDGYPHWGFTDRREGHTCLGTSIRQAATVYKDSKKPATWYPAGVPVPNRIGQGRSRRMEWRAVDQAPRAVKITRHGIVTDENATLRDNANFVIGNVPKGWHVDRTDDVRKDGHWTKVRVAALNLWGYVETRALPDRNTPQTTAEKDAAHVSATPTASTPPTGQVCHWKVTWPTAGVYPTPARTTPIKTKHAGDIVGQSCTTVRNTTENETYVQVTLGTGGAGWMRRNALNPA